MDQDFSTELICTICSGKVKASEFNIYNDSDHEITNLHDIDIPNFIFERESKHIEYPVIWENNCQYFPVIYVICSFQCAKRYRFKNRAHDHDLNFNELTI